MKKKKITQIKLSDRMAEFMKACREANLKLTHQRLEIFRQLAESHDHPTADTIFKRLKKKIPTISFDTIYRTLATFEKHGLVSRVQTIESQARFEAEWDRHHHAVCVQCGRITDFSWDIFEKTKLPREIKNWGVFSKKNATLHGICKQCRTAVK